MLHKLRRNFIITTMSIISVFLVLGLIMLNVLFTTIGRQQNVSTLTMVIQNYGQIMANPEPNRQDDAYDFDSKSLDPSAIYLNFLDEEGEFTHWIVLDEDSTAPENLTQTMEKELLTYAGRYDTVGDYLYVFDEGKDFGVVAVMDTAESSEALLSDRLWQSSLVISLLLLVLLFPICVFLARFVTQAAEKSFERQKQFISDAGHELKTPLSIISVNANVLEKEVGHNRHLGFIQGEITRMHTLISQLLTLAKVETETPKDIKSHFSLSDLLFQAALPFESLAFEKEIVYHMDIPESISYTGYEEELRKVFSILLDNAFKYTSGTVTLALKSQGKHKEICVYNTGPAIDPQDLPHLFERFYRCDKSRTDTEGYGLGLAIAQSIVEQHEGSISVHSPYKEGVLLKVILP